MKRAMAAQFDYIVVGAGPAGCVVAARLSEDPDSRVLLAEAGGPARGLTVTMSAALPFAYQRRAIQWGYTSGPEPHLDGRTIDEKAGRAVGGSSAINAMIYNRGNPMDYDGWVGLGLPDWSYAHCLPYFRRMETNHCTNGLLARKPLSCAVNPDVADSAEGGDLGALGGRRAVVVGSGPAGLEAARRLAVRGASVTVFEASPELGGRLAQWGKAPSRREVARYVSWQRRALDRSGVDIRLGTRADAGAVLALAPDAVILATGAPDIPVLVPSDGSVDVVTADHAFDHPMAGRVVVYDVPGAIDAMLIADYLASLGLQVTLATARIHVGQGEGVTSFYPMLRTIADAGVAIVERVRLAGTGHGHVRLEGIFGEPGRPIAADHLVTWNGGQPDLALSAQLDALGVAHTIIGDAVRPRRFADATAEAKSSVDAWKPAIPARAVQAPL